MSRFLINVARRGSQGGLRPAEMLAIVGPRPDPTAALPVPEALPMPLALVPGNPAAPSPVFTPAVEKSVRSADARVTAETDLRGDSVSIGEPSPPVRMDRLDPPPYSDPHVAVPAEEAARHPASPVALAAPGPTQSGSVPPTLPLGAYGKTKHSTESVDGLPNDAAAISKTLPLTPDNLTPEVRIKNTEMQQPGSVRPIHGKVTPSAPTLPLGSDNVRSSFSAAPVTPLSSLPNDISELPLFVPTDSIATNTLSHPLNREGLQSGAANLHLIPTPATKRSSESKDSILDPTKMMPGEMTVPGSLLPKSESPDPGIHGDLTGRSDSLVRSVPPPPGNNDYSKIALSPRMTSADVVSAAQVAEPAARRPEGTANQVPVKVRSTETVPKTATAVEPALLRSKPPEMPSESMPERLSAGVVPQPKPKSIHALPATSAGAANEFWSDPDRQSLQIHIGSVEVRASSPPTPPAIPSRPRSAFPRGFDNYRHKRSYQGWGW